MSAIFDRIKERDAQVIMRTYGRYPLAVQRAQGARLYDFDGKEYVDLLAGIAVCGLGHGRPDLARVMAEQAEKLVHVSNLFFQEEQIVLAEKLLATCQADKVFFCNSGAEANEGAIKLARRFMQVVRKREAFEIVTLEGSFHGRTLATLTATGQSGKIKDGFGPLPPGFVTVPFADACALRSAVSDRTAAVLVEMVQGEGGVRPLPAEFVDALLALRREKG
ncbi:MAG TPA: aspartate aminotransferase family protein, partial [Desulfovibrio sp.]|nr:aspartate aminotransferase family protein [Desulfovibrio sp.]